MDFLAYSDIHHDIYTNGIELSDTIAVEEQITKYALDNNIKNIFFLGDWFRATNPIREVIAAAEGCWKRRSDHGIHTHVLVGNHDRWTKSINSGHAFVAADIFNSDLKNITIYDKFQISNIDGSKILFIPAGYENHINDLNDSVDIVLFHCLLVHSKLASGISSANGVSIDLFKSINAKTILGGDNHTHQFLNDLLDCNSMYLGATLQHTWGDAGQPRGFWHFMNNGIECKFIDSNSPKFVRFTLHASNEMQAMIDIASKLNGELKSSPGIVEITLIGKNSEQIRDYINNTIHNNFNIRRLHLIVNKIHEITEIASGFNNIQNPEDKWNTYVVSGNVAGMENLSPSMLSDFGVQVIQEAKRDVT